MIRGLFALCLLVLLPFSVFADQPAKESSTIIAPQAELQTVPLIVKSRDDQHKFIVEVARTPEEQALGLMGRTELEPNAGMIFLMNPPQVMSMWMKNTLIPLDMVFVNEQMRIARFHENAKPGDLTPIPSGSSVIAVIEFPAGTIKKLNLRLGDRIISPALIPNKI